jgi:hypothetical protein
VRVWPQRLEMAANNQVLFDFDRPSTTSPFFVLRTTWLSAFRRLRISGTPVIPREVSLIAGHRMDGWMTSFYNESQPPEITVGQSQPGTANVVARSDASDAYDWSANDGELYGRQFSDLTSPDRQSGYQHGESWIYYHRPLRNADRISYEFFYKPGEEAIEVHPTINRVAFLLRRPGVDLHWLTTNRSIDDPDGWIATSNVAVEPECRRGSSPLPLKINDWNTCVVEIRDGTFSLMLNGQLIYERPMDVAAGAKFGLYHDRTRTAARVRNIVLTGDWPEWSPELAASLLERSNPLTPADTEAIENILTPRLTADEPEEM